MPWAADFTSGRADRVAVRSGRRGFSFQDGLAGVEEVALAVATVSQLPDIVANVAHGARRLPGPPAITVGIAPRPDEVLRLVALDGFDASTLDKWGTIPTSMSTPLTDVLRTGEPMYFGSRDELLTQYPALAPDVERTDRQRWAAVPLVSPTGPSGVIGLGWSNHETFTEAEQLYLLALGRLGGEAIRRSARDIERRDLVVLLNEASDRERVELARDLHDHSVQRLAAVLIRLGSLQRRSDTASIGDALVDLERDVQIVVESLRDLIADLDPPDLSGLRLDQAVDEYAGWLLGERVRIVVVGGRDVVLSDKTGATAFRIVQEALSNVAKHAAATSVRVEMACSDGWLQVAVSDDGVGMSDASRSGAGHIGVRSMNERAESLGGLLTISDGPGVTVTARLPFGRSD